ncbi:MAG TPA: hypothetical protein VID68_06905 [Solirubrobacteraceae bacterium]|jgi:hypothetical protein
MRSRFRQRSLLVNPAPVIGAALAAFAIAFGGLTWRLASGHDPAVPLAALRQGAARAAGSGVVTRSSRAGGAPTAGAAGRGGQLPGRIVTASSRAPATARAAEDA